MFYSIWLDDFRLDGAVLLEQAYSYASALYIHTEHSVNVEVRNTNGEVLWRNGKIITAISG